MLTSRESNSMGSIVEFSGFRMIARSLSEESLDGCLVAGDTRYHYVSGSRGLLTLNDDVVASQYARIHHRVASYLKHVSVSAPGKLFGN